MRNHITPGDLPYLAGALAIGVAMGAGMVRLPKIIKRKE